MALALKELTVRPIQMPQYRNERVREFRWWYEDNLAELERYYNELRPFCEEGTEPLEDFFSWAVIQHEREEMIQSTPNFCPKCVGLGTCYCEIASNE